MKFEYISYGGSLIGGLKKDPSVVYIFSDYPLKNSQRKESRRNIFEPDPLYLTIDEFKNMAFKTDKIILSEAKRFVSLYNYMKKEFSELNINNYFESIEFSDKFFKYYTELNRSLCEKNIELEEWQKKYFEIFHRFKEKYEVYLNERNYIPKDWVEDIKYLDLSNFKKYKKIVFVDIVNFTPLDKYILSKLEEFIEVTIRVQGDVGVFDEEKLELKDVYLPKAQKVELSILEVQDELELIGNLLDIMKMKNHMTNIFSPEADTNEYSKIFPNNFMRGSFYTLNDTKFFKFLNAQSELIGAMEPRMDNLIPIKKFLAGIKNLEMQDYYEITKEDMEYIYNQMDWDYKYIGEESNEKISAIYSDILRVSKIQSIDKFIEYFNELLSLDMFREKIYKDFYDKLQEYMGYAKTTEIMLEEKEIKSCFKNGGDILKFLLQYFNDVEIIRNDDSEGKYLIKPMENCKVIPSRESVFINLSTRYLPRVKRDSLYLTEKQKKENGFTYYEKERKEEKYRFYQGLLKNRYNTIIYIKNENSGEGVSPILSEVLNRYKINRLEKTIYSEDILEQLLRFKSQDIQEFFQNPLMKDREDFKNRQLSLGPYDYDILIKCEYRFYLSKLNGLNSFEKEDAIGTSLKFLGTYVHEVFEKLTDKMWKKILNVSDYSITTEEVEELLYKSFYANRKRIPIYLDNYFTGILIPRFTRNIIKFYKEIEDQYIEKKVKRIESEKNSKKEPFLKGDVEVTLNGRVDLVIETTTNNHIIDFKTGSKIDNQLDFYSIMLYGDENSALKSIYNAFDGNMETQDKTKLTREILKENLIEFFKEKEYSLSEKKSGCKYCEYGEICRREF
ncbi:PD-(D/E)XK nuclease family protein [Cetobacterium somerae]|uniref:PD-(D/E)XK nuclease family protein n=1 Tax=Cetobacterium somerae TaxID=188913 RepID=UPI003D7688CE